jgi:hypothetical protein
VICTKIEPKTVMQKASDFPGPLLYLQRMQFKMSAIYPYLSKEFLHYTS